MQLMSYFLSRFCNGGDNVLSLLLGDSWVGGRSAVGQKRPKHKPYDTHCTCTKMSGTNLFVSIHKMEKSLKRMFSPLSCIVSTQLHIEEMFVFIASWHI